MDDLILNCSISVKKSNFNFYNLKLINTFNKNDNDILEIINSQLELYNNILNDCLIKTKCHNDSNYESLVNDLKTNLENEYINNIKSINSDFVNKIKKYETELLNKDLEIETLKKSYNSCYNNIKESIENQLNENYKNKDYIYEQRIISENIKFDELNKQIDNIVDIKSKSIKNEYDIILNNLKNEISSLRLKNLELENISSSACKIDKKFFDLENLVNSKFSNINKFFNNNDAIQSGELGETFIYDFLSNFLLLNTGSIQKVNGKSNAGDLLLDYNNLKCCIESKNHIASIRQENINRFINIDIKNPAYNSGIFVSFKSDYVNSSSIKNFDIKIVDNKPIIFIANLVKKPHELILAIKVIDFILHQKSYDNTNIQQCISFLNSHINSLEHLISINNLITKNVNDSNKRIKYSINEIEDLLNVSSTKSKYKCEICNLGFDKKTCFTKHNNICI